MANIPGADVTRQASLQGLVGSRSLPNSVQSASVVHCVSIETIGEAEEMGEEVGRLVALMRGATVAIGTGTACLLPI